MSEEEIKGVIMGEVSAIVREFRGEGRTVSEDGGIMLHLYDCAEREILAMIVLPPIDAPA